jgi:ribose 5-phosphate isomerase A
MSLARPLATPRAAALPRARFPGRARAAVAPSRAAASSLVEEASSRRFAPLRARGSARRTPRAARAARASPSASSAASSIASTFVDDHVSSGSRVGVGSGALVAAVLSEIHARCADGRLADVAAVPAGTLAAKEAAVAGVPVMDLDDVPAVDVAVLQPDEMTLNVVEEAEGSNRLVSCGVAAVVGRSQRPVQPDLPLLKRVLDKAVSIVLLGDGSGSDSDPAASVITDPEPLGGAVPVAMRCASREEWEEAAEELDDQFLGDAEVWRRGAEPDANPRGGKNPFVSADGGHTIVDLRFADPMNGGARYDEGFVLLGKRATPWEIEAELKENSAVMASGLVLRADFCVVARGRGEGGEGGGAVVETIEVRRA